MKQSHVHVLSDGSIQAGGSVWRFDAEHEPALMLAGGVRHTFSSALFAQKTDIETGLGRGVRTAYRGFDGHDEIAFETEALVHFSDGHVDLTFTMLDEGGVSTEEVLYPAPLIADRDGAYAVLNTMQGQLLPASWPEKIGDTLPFDGQMCSEAAYMPWWGEVTPDGSYLAVVRSPWDTKYTIEHPAGGPNRIYARHLPSLGHMRYQRTISYWFLPAGSTYIDLCKLYRALAEEEGRPVTLREKAVQNKNAERLIGCCVMHVDGKTHVTPASRYYDAEHLEKNDSLTPFSHWAERARQLKSMGVDRLYLHQDGWGQPGYDNQHPDYLPPCKDLGGWEGLKALADTLQSLGYLFGLHDQYRDYYLDAATYRAEHACQSTDGSLYSHAIWAGGRQNYLCAALAPAYVKRNFTQLLDAGIPLNATYLDVFTCNEADECSHPRHPMTRKECLRYRAQCFRYLTAHGIAPSSEEVNDWAMDSLVFCHWAPYPAAAAVPVPLFNLVYHDCVLIPWKMGADEWGIPKGTTGFLHCLLNGGMPYMDERAEGEALATNIRQYHVISALHRQVAMEKMLSHAFLSADKARQRTVFSDGTSVTVDFDANTFEILYPDGKKVNAL